MSQSQYPPPDPPPPFYVPFPSSPPPPKKRRTAKQSLKLFGPIVIIALLVICYPLVQSGRKIQANQTATAQSLADLQTANDGATATVLQSSANGTAEANQQALAATEAARPTDTPAPTGTPAPTKTPAPTRTALEGLVEFLGRVLGDSNRGVQRLQLVDEKDGGLIIQWAINDNITTGMVKGGAKQDVKDLLQTLDQSNIPYAFVILQGTFPLKDTYGNSAEQAVVLVQYNRETVEKINFDGIDRDTIYLIADDVSIVPAFRD